MTSEGAPMRYVRFVDTSCSADAYTVALAHMYGRRCVLAALSKLSTSGGQSDDKRAQR
jgi:hypothetical protein